MNCFFFFPKLKIPLVSDFRTDWCRRKYSIFSVHLSYTSQSQKKTTTRVFYSPFLKPSPSPVPPAPSSSPKPSNTPPS